MPVSNTERRTSNFESVREQALNEKGLSADGLESTRPFAFVMPGEVEASLDIRRCSREP